ncbi:hypothetical protein Tco_0593402 [Tanacetum coccineum]
MELLSKAIDNESTDMETTDKRNTDKDCIVDSNSAMSKAFTLLLLLHMHIAFAYCICSLLCKQAFALLLLQIAYAH